MHQIKNDYLLKEPNSIKLYSLKRNLTEILLYTQGIQEQSLNNDSIFFLLLGLLNPEKFPWSYFYCDVLWMIVKFTFLS